MPDNDVWKIIEQDEFYKQFLQKDVDIKNEAVSLGLSVTEQLKKLTEGITLLDKELQRQVLANHEDLLSQATWVEKLEGVLAVMQTHVQCLLSAVERLRTKIVDPFNKIELQTIMLSRLHATSDLLRRVARIQHLSRRLTTQMQGSTPDITKAAQSLNELTQLSEDVDLSGLEVLEEDQHLIRSHRIEVERQAKLMLTQGLQTQNMSQVGIAVQVFYNLGSLDSTVSHVLETAERNIKQSIKEALDVNKLSQTSSSEVKSRGGPGRAAMPSPGNTANFRSRLWTALEHLFDSSMCTEYRQIELLQRLLVHKLRGDSGMLSQHNSTCYMDLLPQEKQQLASHLWQSVTNILAQELAQAAQGSMFVKQALEGEYPKFLRLYLDMCKKIQTYSQNSDNTEATLPKSVDQESGDSGNFHINRTVVSQFENAYLSRSVSRLLDPVQLMFSGDAVPPHEEVDSLIRTITSELSVSLVDVSLSRTVARNISKTVRLFCLKCEQMIVTDGEATQVIDSSTPGQMLNVSIANLLHYLNGQVGRVMSNMKTSLSSDAANIVQESLSYTDRLIENILTPLLASISDAIEAIILTMHNEDYSMGPAAGDSDAHMGMRKSDAAQCSLYMKELQGFIARAASNYLVSFQNQDIVMKCSVPVASRCIELFLNHSCLVRPLGEGGRARLAADFSQMEVAVAPLCRQTSELSRQFRMLRSLRPLLFLSSEEVAESPALGDVIPYSLVLLSMFSRGPNELLSPHQSANWSVSRFSQWLDSHPSERERLELMGGALQRYQQVVRQRGGTSFHAVYPIMITLLERGMVYSTK
ncbi:conserved oligomeric Golgi complex subunit 5 [Periplaneta americana]|uniref:conserved oligomeric Golgi complex subunit 5 n=1 Tax=Periplaneta americana TaxID=6978 RepID=UPI0037E6FC39